MIRSKCDRDNVFICLTGTHGYISYHTICLSVNKSNHRATRAERGVSLREREGCKESGMWLWAKRLSVTEILFSATNKIANSIIFEELRKKRNLIKNTRITGFKGELVVYIKIITWSESDTKTNVVHYILFRNAQIYISYTGNCSLSW